MKAQAVWYHGTTFAKEFVLAHWERAEACPHPSSGRYCISLGGRGFTRTTIPDTISGYAADEAEAWEAAAEYTRERLEAIRQVEEEIAMIERQLACQPEEWEVSAYSGDDIRSSQRNVARWSRIMAREQAVLSDLKWGMKCWN